LYAVLDTETGMLRHAIAGHPPPLLVRRGCSPQPLTGGNFPIGMIEDATDKALEKIKGKKT